MTWTTTRPDKDGWYWIKDGSAIACVQLETGTFDAFYFAWVWQVGLKIPTPLSEMKDLEWAGPIPEPVERDERETQP